LSRRASFVELLERRVAAAPRRRRKPDAKPELKFLLGQVG
jgi:hypothetical protein